MTEDLYKCCGEKKHKSKSECPAKDNECTCGRFGHFKKFCFSGGKKKTRKAKQEKVETKPKEESGNCIETMFSITEDEATLPEACLASLQFNNDTNKWVERAKSENDNTLHLIIRPEVQHWPDLQKDNTVHPTQVNATKPLGVADTGASVTCTGPFILRRLGLKPENLCPTKTVIRTANRTPLSVLGMFPATVQIVGHPERKSKQLIYVASEVKEMFISRTSLQELGSLPPTWLGKLKHVLQMNRTTLLHVGAQSEQLHQHLLVDLLFLLLRLKSVVRDCRSGS